MLEHELQRPLALLAGTWLLVEVHTFVESELIERLAVEQLESLFVEPTLGIEGQRTLPWELELPSVVAVGLVEQLLQSQRFELEGFEVAGIGTAAWRGVAVAGTERRLGGRMTGETNPHCLRGGLIVGSGTCRDWLVAAAATWWCTEGRLYWVWR